MSFVQVKPRYLVALVPLFGVLVMAGGWVAINSISRTACESQENDALLQFWNAANGIQEEVVTHTYAATTIASYVRQQPNLQEILDYPFQDIATDLLALDSSVINLQIAPGGRVNTIVPLAGSEGAIGHDLFLVCMALAAKRASCMPCSVHDASETRLGLRALPLQPMRTCGVAAFPPFSLVRVPLSGAFLICVWLLK